MEIFTIRCNAIAERRWLKKAGYVCLLFLNIYFIASVIFVSVAYPSDPKTFIKFENDISFMTPSYFGVLMVGLVFGWIVAFLDLRRFLNRISIHLVGYEGWVLGLGVDVLFDWLDKLDSVQDAVDQDKVKVLSIVGYAVIGIMITTIGINYIKDRTGLTVASFIAGVKVTMKYRYEKAFRKPSGYQWIMILGLILSCFLCKLTEGTGDEPELQPAIIPAVIPPQNQTQNSPAGGSPHSGRTSRSNSSNSARHRKGAGNA